MLRWAASCPRQTGHEEPGAGRRRGAQLRGQRPAPARRAVRRHLDSAGGRRRRRRARRGAVRLASAARASRGRTARADRQKGSFLGPAFASTDVCAVPRRRRRRRTARATSEAELLEQVADLLGDEKVVGWFQGRMEFGPRALGARSILGDPRSPKMQATMNLKIKFRESFRPFAPIVLRERGARVVRARAGPGEPVHAAGRAGARAASRADHRRTARARWRTIPTCATA